MELNAETMQTIQAFLVEEGMNWGINIATALALFIFGRWVVKGITSITKRLMNKAKLDETLVSFLGNIIYTLALTFVIIAALSQLGIETTSLAAIFAAAGLAIGLSLQGSLSNLAAGVMIISFRPFTKGDFIEAGGTSGTVQEVTIFTTVLKTADNKKVIVPNGGIIGGTITNYSAEKTRRVDMTFGIGYGDDIKKAKDVLQSVLDADDRILKDPAPVIAVSELADSSVNFAVRPWVNSSDYWGVYFDITEAVKLRFDAEGLSIPFPQQDVYMHQVEVGGKAAA